MERQHRRWRTPPRHFGASDVMESVFSLQENYYHRWPSFHLIQEWLHKTISHPWVSPHFSHLLTNRAKFEPSNNMENFQNFLRQSAAAYQQRSDAHTVAGNEQAGQVQKVARKPLGHVTCTMMVSNSQLSSLLFEFGAKNSRVVPISHFTQYTSNLT